MTGARLVAERAAALPTWRAVALVVAVSLLALLVRAAGQLVATAADTVAGAALLLALLVREAVARLEGRAMARYGIAPGARGASERGEW